MKQQTYDELGVGTSFLHNAETVFTEFVLYCRTMGIGSSEIGEVMVGLGSTAFDRRITRTDGRNTTGLTDRAAVQQAESLVY